MITCLEKPSWVWKRPSDGQGEGNLIILPVEAHLLSPSQTCLVSCLCVPAEEERGREREKKRSKTQWISDYLHVAASVKLLPWLTGAPVWMPVSQMSGIIPNESEMKGGRHFGETGYQNMKQLQVFTFFTKLLYKLNKDFDSVLFKSTFTAVNPRDFKLLD